MWPRSSSSSLARSRRSLIFIASSLPDQARRPFAAIDPADGLPDGLCVDADGGVWVALFGGGAVRCYSPTGELEAVIEFPVTNTPCPAFGGPELETLYVTTTRHLLSSEALAAQPLAGALFKLQPGVRGLPTSLFAG